VDPIILLRSIGIGLVSPTVILPAIVIGLLCRRWWQVFAAVVILCFVFLAIQIATLPSEAMIVWYTTPIGLIAPMAWASAAFALRRRLGPSHADTPGRRAGWRVVATFAGLLLGGVLGGAIGIGLGLLAVEAFHISSFEGKSGYLVFFAFMPLGALLGMTAGGLLGWWLAGRGPALAAGPG
jgi:hypothetical protein